ncbi:MAG: potassium channel family protein, partial [Candidatus Cloacimonetes bacterium]|nr:potassium channel family protein [Candidatus Cloacimonadota bacterium]
MKIMKIMKMWKRYKVEIVNEQYKRKSDGKIFNETRKIHFFDENDEDYKTISYGYVTPEEVIKDIKAGKEINLSYCYVNKLSLGLALLDIYNGRRIKVKLHNAKNAFFDGGLNFSGAEFEDGKVDFTLSKFGDGDVNCEYDQFGDGKASFNRTQFGNGKVSFNWTQFGEGDVSFNETQFGEGDVSFIRTQFGTGYVSFYQTQFSEGNVSFDWTQFSEGNVNFYCATFGVQKDNSGKVLSVKGNVTFQNTKFGEGDVSFSNAKFGVQEDNSGEVLSVNGNVSFKETKFGKGDVDFSEMKVNKLSFNTMLIEQFLNFKKATVNELCFSNCELQRHINATSIAKLGSLEFDECINPGYINIRWKKNMLKKAVNRIKSKTKGYFTSRADKHNRRMETCLLLKENFRKLGFYADEDEAYYTYSKNKIRGEFWGFIAGEWHRKLNILWATLLFIIKLIFLEIMGGFGTNPLSVFLSMIITWLSFGLFYFWRLFYCLEKFEGDSVEILHLSKWGQAFYHSAVTFLTIGYGDLYPASATLRVASGLEGFAGLFLMSFFTVAVVRKV